MLEPGERGDAWAIAEILPRRSKLARRAPGGGQGERIVAANVDQVVVVFAAAKPEPHPRMLDRFLVIAEGNDLRRASSSTRSISSARRRRASGSTTTSARAIPFTTRASRPASASRTLRDVLDGRRSVLTGPSGVGKSSLLNALFPGANLRVGAISESVNKGRHTTVGALMLPLPGERRRLRHRHAGAARGRPLGAVAGATGPVLSRDARDCAMSAGSPIVVTSPSRIAPCAPRFATARSAPQRYDSYMRLLEEMQSGQ